MRKKHLVSLAQSCNITIKRKIITIKKLMYDVECILLQSDKNTSFRTYSLMITIQFFLFLYIFHNVSAVLNVVLILLLLFMF